MTYDIVSLPSKKRRTSSKRPKTALKRKKKEKTISALTKELDTVVSRFVRLSRADPEGMVICYTCGHKAHYKKIHAGHYITRFFKATRWDLRNLRPQCFMCNIYRKGNAVIFRQNLVKEYGEEEIKEMEKSVDFLVRGGLRREYLQEQIAVFAAKTDILTSDPAY